MKKSENSKIYINNNNNFDSGIRINYQIVNKKNNSSSDCLNILQSKCNETNQNATGAINKIFQGSMNLFSSPIRSQKPIKQKCDDKKSENFEIQLQRNHDSESTENSGRNNSHLKEDVKKKAAVVKDKANPDNKSQHSTSYNNSNLITSKEPNSNGPNKVAKHFFKSNSINNLNVNKAKLLKNSINKVKLSKNKISNKMDFGRNLHPYFPEENNIQAASRVINESEEECLYSNRNTNNHIDQAGNIGTDLYSNNKDREKKGWKGNKIPASFNQTDNISFNDDESNKDFNKASIKLKNIQASSTNFNAGQPAKSQNIVEINIKNKLQKTNRQEGLSQEKQIPSRAQKQKKSTKKIKPMNLSFPINLKDNLFQINTICYEPNVKNNHHEKSNEVLNKRMQLENPNETMRQKSVKFSLQQTKVQEIDKSFTTNSDSKYIRYYKYFKFEILSLKLFF